MIFTIIKNNIKKDFKLIISIFILSLMSFAFLLLSINMSINTKDEIERRLSEEQFGDMLVLTSEKLPVIPTLNYIRSDKNIESINNYEIIYSSYEFKDKKSDVDAILFKASDRKLKDNLLFNDIIVPISMKGMLQVDVNDEIILNIKRGKEYKFKIKNFFEDEIFGSSMIGMKRFYIADNSFDEIKNEIMIDEINNLAKTGHSFFIKGKDGVEFKTLSNIWYDNPNISNSIEHMYSKNTIVSYMSLLLNIFIAFLFVFSLLLEIVAVVIIYYILKNNITYDKPSISNLKILGYKSIDIIIIYLVEWNFPIIFAIIIAFIIFNPIMSMLYSMTYVANGIMYDGKIFIACSLLVVLIVVIFINTILVLNLKKIYKIKPVETKNNNGLIDKKYPKITSSSILFISIREIISRKRHYIMLTLVCILLSVFNNQVYRINTWLDNGKGLMNSFNPTDMDYGVQSVKDVDINEVIQEVDKFNGIEYTYMLGMSNLNIDGNNLRVNVSSDTEKFHILKGRTIKNSDEILVTDIVSNNISKSIGDYVNVRGTKNEGKFRIVGIYECANEMGDNVGISKDGFEKISDVAKNFYCYHFFLKNKNTDSLTRYLSDKYGAGLYTHTNTWSGLESIVNAMNILLKLLITLTIIIALIVTIIQVNDILKNENENLNIYKLLGFNKKELVISFMIRFLIVSIVGVLIGIIMVKLFSDDFINYIFRFYGICAYKSHFTIYNAVLSLFIILLFGILAYCFSNKTLKTAIV